MEDFSNGGLRIVYLKCVFSSVIAAFWKSSFEAFRAEPAKISPEIRLQVACFLPCNPHVNTHPNPGGGTEYTELLKVFLLQQRVLNTNTTSEFDLFVDDASFQS